MIRTCYRLDLTLQAPVLTHAASTLTLGLDAATQRYRGRPVLNGSLIRGNLRHLLDRFAADLAQEPDPPPFSNDPRPLRSDDIATWFGPAQPERDANGEPRIADLTFDFFWTIADPGHPPPNPQPARHRIRIGATGTVETGQIQVAESAFPVGAEPQFTGLIRARFASRTAQRHAERWLGKALALLPALGAQKGVGFGRILRAELSRVEPVATIAPPVTVRGLGPRIGLVLTLDRPFNVAQIARFQPVNNRYLNHDQIPGSAIKAVMARAHGGGSQALQDDLDFDRLVVTAAQPALRGQPGRPLPLPLSLAVFDTPAGPLVHDLALEPGPCLLQHNEQRLPPIFLPDWKPHHRRAAEAHGGRTAPAPDHLLVVRTAIRPAANVAEESQLFALECTDVLDHGWCLDLDLHQVHPGDYLARRAVTERLIELLQGGLEGLGKTRALARVEVRSQPFSPIAAPQPIQIGEDSGWVVLLRTPARLLPAAIERCQIPPTNGSHALKAAYADYWRAACPGLELSHYYAQQELVGGDYYWRHFRGGEDYRPEWLTLAGSVFVLKSRAGTDPAAVSRTIEEWLRSGLPQSKDRATDTWETNPYLRENGFGEVAINDPAHLALAQAGLKLHRLPLEAS